MKKDDVTKFIRFISTQLLTVFVTLKLTGYVEWSWVWVLAPFWIPFAVFLISLMFAGAMIFSLKKDGITFDKARVAREEETI